MWWANPEEYACRNTHFSHQMFNTTKVPLLLNFTQIYSPSKYMANTEVNMVKYFQNFGKVTFNAKNPKIRFSFLGLFGLKTTICIDFAVVNTYCVSSTNCAIYSQCQFFTLPEPISWKIDWRFHVPLPVVVVICSTLSLHMIEIRIWLFLSNPMTLDITRANFISKYLVFYLLFECAE